MLLVMGCACAQSDEDLKTLLQDKKLSTASSSGASSSSNEIYFCPNGEYAWVFESSIYSTGGAGTLSSGGRSVERGRWDIQGGSVVMQSSEGENHELPVSRGMDENVITLGTLNYLIGTHNECE